MSKINNIVDIIEAGIKAESLRQKSIANNVANLETPGYRRVDVKFQELLAQALDSSEDGVDLSEVEGQIYQPKQTEVKSNGNDVSLEVEIGGMVKNILRHKAYIRLLQKKYQQIELAINVK
jgi:flagellar basal-body rod protein FlgB